MYAARHRHTGILCCVKKYHKERLALEDEMHQRLAANEVEATMQLDHPCFVKLIQLINSTKHFYIVYEFVNGHNLKRTLTSVGGFTDR